MPLDDRIIRLGPVERPVYLPQDLRRKRIALAIVDTNGGHTAFEAVVHGVHGLAPKIFIQRQSTAHARHSKPSWLL